MRKEKQLLLDEIKEKVDESNAMIVMRYSQLQPNASWQLRDNLAKKGGVLEVVQKRVFMKALAASSVKIDEALLEGHIGAVFVTEKDSTPCVKEVFEFSKENGDVFDVICGSIDGEIVPGKELEILSKLPGLDEMRAIMIALFTAPMSQVLSVMEAKIEAESSSDEKCE